MDEVREGRGQFTFYRSYFDAAQMVSAKRRLAFYDAVIDYALNENLPTFTDSSVEAIFVVVKPTLDAGRKKAGAGARGGKASLGVKKNSKTESAVADDNSNIEIENKIKNKNENENENENEKEVEIESKCYTRAEWVPPKAGERVRKSPELDCNNRAVYGEFGRVKLSNLEHLELVNAIGLDETEKCISFLDYQTGAGGLADVTDWAAEVRRCSAQKRYSRC